jgi:hypothetical protein
MITELTGESIINFEALFTRSWNTKLSKKDYVFTMLKHAGHLALALSAKEMLNIITRLKTRAKAEDGERARDVITHEIETC